MTDDFEDDLDKLVAGELFPDFVRKLESENRLRVEIQRGLDDAMNGRFFKQTVADIATEVRRKHMRDDSDD